MNILLTRPLIDTEDLMGKFFSLGHKIIHIPTLKISAANIDPIDAKKYDAFIFTSANAIRNLKLINQDKDKTCFCVGSITEKITDLNEENNKIITHHPPDIIFIYSKRSAESFVEIVKKYALNGLMTESRVLCISEKVLRVLKDAGWKKLENFEPGEEIMKLEV